MSDSTSDRPFSPPVDSSRLIPCVAGIRSDKDNNKTLWIESPRTHRRIFIPGGWFNELPPRVVSRIVHARGNGRPTVELSTADLLGVKRLRDALDAYDRRPRLPRGPMRRESRRFRTR